MSIASTPARRPAAYAVILAGGTGARMNSQATPKQFLQIHGKSILEHTLAHFWDNPEIDGIVVVCLEDWIPQLNAELVASGRSVDWVVAGGATNQESIFNGLDALRRAEVAEDSVVLVHDSVRPLIYRRLISANIRSVLAHGSAVTVGPAIETVITFPGQGPVDEVLDRNATHVAKAPQSFRLGDLLRAHEEARAEGQLNHVDSASLMFDKGHELWPVFGPAENIKVTTPTDFYMVRAVLDAHEAQLVFGFGD